jgi:hypothetical protein
MAEIGREGGHRRQSHRAHPPPSATGPDERTADGQARSPADHPPHSPH